VKNANIVCCHTISNKVKINLDVLGALMLDRVGSHVHRADVVTVYQNCTMKGSVELMKKLSQPGRLGDCIGDGAILGFGAGSGDCILPLGGP
jgi:hypothetical protein